MTCEGDGGRYNADGSCTSAADLMAEAKMTCEGDGGRWNGGTADDMCSDVTELAEEQRMDINRKIAMAQSAVDAVNNESDDAMVTAADNAVSTASMAVADAANIVAGEKAALNLAIKAIQDNLATRKLNRQMAMDEADRMTRDAMVTTATKLYAGISAPTISTAPTATDARVAVYNDAGTPTDAAADTHIMVSIGDGANPAVAVPLSEDKKAMVDDNYGWEGKKYTAAPTGDGTYEAVVYSNVGDPMEGEKFSVEYTLANGALALITSGSAQTAFAATRVASPDFDQSAGLKQFKLPPSNLDDPASSETTRNIPGTYHGVPGIYTCTPGAGLACGVRVAANAEGFELGTTTVPTDGTNPEFTNNGGTWTFTPTNRDTRVMSVPDSVYVSYGWWIHKAADDGAFTASVFADERGSVPNAIGLDALNGTGMYMGGAAGKYALSSSTGGMNDAGHFTARATLEANFTNNTDADAITGTIDNFIGADGESREWKVELKGSRIGDTGILNTTGAVGGAGAGTVWTIDEVAADADGEWSGSLQNNGADGVPQVATGTFHSLYRVDGGSREGTMVGAFGANKME